MKFLLFNIAVIAALAYLFLEPAAEQTDELAATATRVGGETVTRAKATIQDLVSEFRTTPRRSEIQVPENEEAAAPMRPAPPMAPERWISERDVPELTPTPLVETLVGDGSSAAPAEGKERSPVPPADAIPAPTTPLTPLPTVSVARVEVKPPRPVTEEAPRRDGRRNVPPPKRLEVSPGGTADPEPVFMSRRERARELNRLAREMEAVFVERLPE